MSFRKIRLMRGSHLFFVLLFVCRLQALTFDDSYIQGDLALSSTKCSLDTSISFRFSSSSTLSCTSNDCRVSNAEQNQIFYLAAQDRQIAFILKNAQLVQEPFMTGCDFGFLFEFVDQSSQQLLYLTTPICTKVPPAYSSSTIDLSTSADYSLTTLRQLTDSALESGIPLSGFNFLSRMDFKQFYQVKNSVQTQTWLVSKKLFKINFSPITKGSKSLLASFIPDYTTAKVICWRSVPENMPQAQLRMLYDGVVGTTLVYDNLFQTHMRESIVLWFFVIMVLLMWIFVLCSNQNTDEVFQASFQNNKWTSWSLYSLFNLAHEEFFTRLSRTVLIIITISWQAMVTAAIYSRIPESQTNAVIIWAAVVGWAASIPFPYFFGGCFLKRIYENEIQRYTMKIQAHKLDPADKVKKEQLQRQVILKSEHINSIYYFYYAIILSLFAVFAILSVHVMQPFTDSIHYRYEQWLATMGIILLWEYLIVEPFMTACFGQTTWFASRGFYFNAQLSKLYKQVE